MPSYRNFLLMMATAIVFLLVSGMQLPPDVAAHFVAGGVANGYAPRGIYLLFMTTFIVFFPVLIVLISALMQRLPLSLINLPHKAYWLAPERREASFQFMRVHTARFGSLLIVFLCYVHYLVLQANAQDPPQLPQRALIAGLAAFVLLTAAWAASFIRHFRKRP